MSISQKRSPGFTLIELMVVLAIMGGVVAMSMPYITNRNAESKKVLRDLTVLSRELHTRAKLQGVVYRLVIDLKMDKDGKRPKQSYWVEKGNANTVLKPNEEEAEMDAIKDLSDEDKKKPDPSGFQVDHSMVREPRELPRGMSFDKVELTRLKSPVSEGKVYIHYMPQGLVDEAAIHIKGEKNAEWTISIHPLTGKGELVSKTLSLHDIRSQ